MKNILILFIFAFLPILAGAQVVGGSGQCKTAGNPNGISALDNQLAKFECWFVTDTATGLTYRYEPQNSVGSRWVEMGDAGVATGITSINSQSGAAQTIAVGTTGTDFNIVSGSNTHTLHLPTASATNRGALSSADWTTFNNKDGSATNEGSLTVAAGTGTTSVINSNTSGSTGVTIEAGTGLSISEVGSTITLANTGDLSNTNEGSLTVTAGTSTTSVITSNTTGSTGVTFGATASSGLVIVETGNVIDYALSSLSAKSYDNQFAAGTAGVAAGQWFRASATNTMGVPEGTPIIKL